MNFGPGFLIRDYKDRKKLMETELNWILTE